MNLLKRKGKGRHTMAAAKNRQASEAVPLRSFPETSYQGTLIIWFSRPHHPESSSERQVRDMATLRRSSGGWPPGIHEQAGYRRIQTSQTFHRMTTVMEAACLHNQDSQGRSCKKSCPGIIGPHPGFARCVPVGSGSFFMHVIHEICNIIRITFRHPPSDPCVFLPNVLFSL